MRQRGVKYRWHCVLANNREFTNILARWRDGCGFLGSNKSADRNLSFFEETLDHYFCIESKRKSLAPRTDSLGFICVYLVTNVLQLNVWKVVLVLTQADCRFDMALSLSSFLFLCYGLLLHPVSGSRVTFLNYGYRDIVIAISPNVPHDQANALLKQIEVITYNFCKLLKTLCDNFCILMQVLITDASSALYIATRKRAYIQSVNILIPQSWNTIEANRSTWENFNVNVSSFHSIVMTWSIKCMLFFFLIGCGSTDWLAQLAIRKWTLYRSVGRMWRARRLHSFDAQLHNDCQLWWKHSQIRTTRLKYN